VEIAEAFVTFTRNRRPWTEQELGNSCGPLTPGDWRFLVMAHAQDPEAADQCALSRARGVVVRGRLAALGLPEAEIVVMAFGDQRPMVLAPLERAEPQNRRVELGYVTAESLARMRMHPELCPG
jgi:hypothetical protein